MALKLAQTGRNVGYSWTRLWRQQTWKEGVKRTETGLWDHGTGDMQFVLRTLSRPSYNAASVETVTGKSWSLRELLSNLQGQREKVESRLGKLIRPIVEPIQSAREIGALGCRIVAKESVHRHSPLQTGQSLPWNLGRALQRRSYYTDSRGVVHFKRRGPVVWIQEPSGGGRNRQQKLLIILGVGGCGCAYIYYNNLQIVPYTHRQHFVLIKPSLERSLGEQEFNNLKAQYSAKILPPIHPLGVRVRRIAKDVIEAAMAGVKAQGWDHIEHPHVPSQYEGRSPGDQTKSGRDHLQSHKTSEDLYGNEKLEDDMWVDKSRKKGLDEGLQGYTAHLDGLKWEVIVVDEDTMNAFCLPGGKIVVFTGLLKQFRSDAEIATVLGHEVGHVVARHVAEKLTQGVWLGFLQLIVLSFVYVPGLISSTSDLLLKLPFSRRMESEADHIGLMLMAAAGYDPKLAPGFYEKMGNLEKEPEFLRYASTHPSGKKRAEALRESGTMQEAVTLYDEKIAGASQPGFSMFLH